MSLPPSAPETPEVDEPKAATAEVLEPDEAPTPAWLPLVGLGLLFVAVLALSYRSARRHEDDRAPARASVMAEPSADAVAPAPSRGRQPMPKPAGCAE
jgi:cbb3-type cytochrome oxidase subunit 3